MNMTAFTGMSHEAVAVAEKYVFSNGIHGVEEDRWLMRAPMPATLRRGSLPLATKEAR
jgi:hypothetical protein